jgi:hypothetical protein
LWVPTYHTALCVWPVPEPPPESPGPRRRLPPVHAWQGHDYVLS